MRILRPHFSTMPQKDLDNLMAAATTNRVFYTATECRMTYLPELVRANSSRLSKEQIASLQKMLDEDKCFAHPIVLIPGDSQQTNAINE